MPQRIEPLLNEGIYHVFNKTINSQYIFDSDDNCLSFIERIKYYRSEKAVLSFSHLNQLEDETRDRILQKTLLKRFFKIDIFAYSLMPTHFHFLLKQKKDLGIQKFMADTMNSFTRNFNIKSEKIGPLFLPRFKAVRINTDHQAMHVSRYIHLNYYSSGLIKKIEDLETYQWSSFKEYIEESRNGLCNTKFILDLFGGDRGRYQKFVFDNADDQKSLESIKHIRKW